MATLLDLPPELRTRILEHLFASCIPETFPGPVTMAPSKPQENFHKWLTRLHFCIVQNHISPDPDAPSGRVHEDRRRPSRSAGDAYDGIFTANQLLRHEARAVWYALSLFVFRENERRATAFPSRYKKPGHLRAFPDVRGVLGRVRNCEVVFDVESGRDMLRLPSRLAELLDELDLERVRHVRVAIKFVKTHLRGDGRRILATGGSATVKQKSVGEASWARFLADMEGLDLKRFAKGAEDWHRVYAWSTWKVAEKGIARFEELGKIIGAEVTSTDHH